MDSSLTIDQIYELIENCNNQSRIIVHRSYVDCQSMEIEQIEQYLNNLNIQKDTQSQSIEFKQNNSVQMHSVVQQNFRKNIELNKSNEQDNCNQIQEIYNYTDYLYNSSVYGDENFKKDNYLDQIQQILDEIDDDLVIHRQDSFE